jgi:chromosome segregation ATPase
MAFERLQNSIINLKDRTSISADALTALLDCAILDVLAINNTRDITVLDVAESKKFLSQLCAVNLRLSNLYERHSNILTEFSDEDHRNSLRGVFDKTEKTARELEEINKKIREQEEANSKLVEEESKLERERGHLLDAEAQRDKLQKDIARLSDPALDAMAAERDELEAELADRKRREDELLGATQRLKEKLEAAERDCKTKQSEAQALQESIDASNEELSRLKESIDKREETLAGIKAVIEGLQAGQKSFEEKRDKLAAERYELEQGLNIYINVLSAEPTQQYFSEYAAESGLLAKLEGLPRTEEGYESLQEAVNAASKSLADHFLEYSDLISRLVRESQDLTKTPDKNQEGETE